MTPELLNLIERLVITIGADAVEAVVKALLHEEDAARAAHRALEAAAAKRAYRMTAGRKP